MPFFERNKSIVSWNQNGMTKTRGQEQFGLMKLFKWFWLFGQLLNKPIVISTKIESSLFQARVSLRIDLGPEYLISVSSRSLKTRENHTNWDNSVCLSLYIFWAQSHLCLLVFCKCKHRWLCAQKIYKPRQTKLSQFVYFSLVLREREETKTKYSAP